LRPFAERCWLSADEVFSVLRKSRFDESSLLPSSDPINELNDSDWMFATRNARDETKSPVVP